MSAPQAPTRGRVWRPLLLTLPLIAGGLCCWLALRPLDRAQVLPSVDLAQSGLEDHLEGIEPSQVEALAVDRRGEVIELGLLLATIEIQRTDDGLSKFQAELFNLGDFPVENARVELRLADEAGRFVDVIVLTSDEAILPPRQWIHLAGSYQVGRDSPRIVEERLSLATNRTVNFTTYSYGETKRSPGALRFIASILPFLTYDAMWTRPESEWASYEIQFALDRILTD